MKPSIFDKFGDRNNFNAAILSKTSSITQTHKEILFLEELFLSIIESVEEYLRAEEFFYHDVGLVRSILTVFFPSNESEQDYMTQNRIVCALKAKVNQLPSKSPLAITLNHWIGFIRETNLIREKKFKYIQNTFLPSLQKFYTNDLLEYLNQYKLLTELNSSNDESKRTQFENQLTKVNRMGDNILIGENSKYPLRCIYNLIKMEVDGSRELVNDSDIILNEINELKNRVLKLSIFLRDEKSHERSYDNSHEKQPTKSASKESIVPKISISEVDFPKEKSLTEEENVDYDNISEPTNEMDVEENESEPVSQDVFKNTPDEIKADESDGNSVQPEMNCDEPERNSVEPEMNSIEPKMNVEEPEMNSVEPVRNSVEPEMNFDDPDMIDIEPVRNSVKSAKNSVKSDRNSIEPKMNVEEPEMNSVEPEMNFDDPDMIDIEPVRNSVKSVKNSVKPEMNSVEPEMNSSKPEMNSVEPEMNSVEPEMNSSKPEKNSSEPERNSANPSLFDPNEEIKSEEKNESKDESELMEIDENLRDYFKTSITIPAGGEEEFDEEDLPSLKAEDVRKQTMRAKQSINLYIMNELNLNPDDDKSLETQIPEVLLEKAIKNGNWA